MRLMKLVACALAATALLTPKANAQAPTPEEVAQACISEMATVTQHTVGIIAYRTQVGVHQINFLQSHGAPPPVVVYFARLSAQSIKAAARHGKYVVDHIAGACLAVLNDLNAPDPIKHAVIVAHAKAIDVIGQALHHGLGAIGDALNSAPSNIVLDSAS